MPEITRDPWGNQVKPGDAIKMLICWSCGHKYGKYKCNKARWKNAVCDICEVETGCTKPADYGYLKPGVVIPVKGLRALFDKV